MIDFSCMNSLRRSTLLRDYGLDRPLSEDELALRLLDIEIRLDQGEERLRALDEGLRRGNSPIGKRGGKVG